MSHYARIGAVVIRSFGLLALLYAIPKLLWVIGRLVLGATSATDGQTPIGAVVAAWLSYAIAGLLLVGLSKPLGRIVARGFDEADPAPPAT
ncbi:MAG TPA: hypothetical protein VEA99_18025 [Gemmatimonadaceae bacterium]|nr:hypothetical protein [Gemmatimonadaceae bacterium]